MNNWQNKDGRTFSGSSAELKRTFPEDKLTPSRLSEVVSGKSSHSKGWSVINEDAVPQVTTEILLKKRYVVTSAQNDTKVNSKFFRALKNYCKRMNAQLLVLPVRQGLITNAEWSSELPMIYDDSKLPDSNFLLAGSVLPLASAKNPLSGLKQDTGNRSVVFGGTSVQLQGKPTGGKDSEPLWLMSTGSITEPNYQTGKIGFGARFHHGYGAVVIEGNHFRQLLADHTGGFFDYKGYYKADGGFEKLVGTPALVTGDSHAIFEDPMVTEATFSGRGSIAKTLKPEVIVRHDLVDSKSISHHDEKNMIKRYKTTNKGLDCLQSELKNAYDYLVKTTPKNASNLIVQSNHDGHIDQWIAERAYRGAMKNLAIWHILAYMKLTDKKGRSALELWMNNHDMNNNLLESSKFISGGHSIKGIEIGFHGDNGLNGSRGSVAQFGRLDKKTIIGHSHSPSISQGCYQVGTSTKNLDYAEKGLSTWSLTHCVIYPNGKRQLITVDKTGSWKG